jgi:uncharacterized protein (TIGR00369 family)
MYRLKDLPPFSPQQQERMRNYRPSPIFELLGIRLVKLEPGLAVLELPIRKELTHNGGIVQGGVICTLGDSAIAFAVRTGLPDDAGQTSIDLKINFIRPISSGTVTCEGWLTHLGARTAVGESIVLNEQGKTVAKCLSSVLIMPGGRPSEI